MNNNSELHLFILWKNALNKKNEIVFSRVGSIDRSVYVKKEI